MESIPHLHTSLRKRRLRRQPLPRRHARIVRSFEFLLELLQLFRAERRTIPPEFRLLRPVQASFVPVAVCAEKPPFFHSLSLSLSLSLPLIIETTVTLQVAPGDGVRVQRVVRRAGGGGGGGRSGRGCRAWAQGRRKEQGGSGARDAGSQRWQHPGVGSRPRRRPTGGQVVAGRWVLVAAVEVRVRARRVQPVAGRPRELGGRPFGRAVP